MEFKLNDEIDLKKLGYFFFLSTHRNATLRGMCGKAEAKVINGRESLIQNVVCRTFAHPVVIVQHRSKRNTVVDCCRVQRLLARFAH